MESVIGAMSELETTNVAADILGASEELALSQASTIPITSAPSSMRRASSTPFPCLDAITPPREVPNALRRAPVLTWCRMHARRQLANEDLTTAAGSPHPPAIRAATCACVKPTRAQDYNRPTMHS